MNILRSLKRFGSFAILSAVMTAAGCGGSDGGGAGSGTLSLQITDAAVDSAEHVYIQFSGLEIQAAGGGRTTLYYCQDPADPTKTILSQVPCTTPVAPKQLDLLALSGGQAETLLNHFTLPAGHYVWIRLMVDTAGTRDSYIVLLGGAEHELTIPSGDQTGLKLNRGFNVPAGGSADFTIDFDLRKSVHVTGTGDYMLRPTLRLADNTLAGAIAGTVNAALVPGGCTPAVYVFEGGGVTPDDIDGTPADPVTTATVKLDGGVYKYKAAFLEAGSYTVAYTCQAALDDPAVNDALVFSGTATVLVAAAATTVHDF
jgi:hypothetical protein